MPNIAVVCPSCNESFKLDDAFAGQACRCAHCGTLMTVPDDPTSQKIEAITDSSPEQAVGATGTAEKVDEDVLIIGEFLSQLYDPDEGFEIRAPDVGERRGSSSRYAVRGFYDDIDKSSRDISRLDNQRRATGIYVTLNPIARSLVERAPNQMVKQPNVMTSDKDIVRRKWLCVEIEAIRPRRVMCTETEIDFVFDHIERIADDLSDAGWSDPLQCHCGNSLQLLYPIDLPAEDNGLVQSCLKALHKKYSNDEGKVNIKAYRPSHLILIMGTWLREGRNLVNLEDAEDRPHRQSTIISTPMEEMKPVSEKLLKELAAAGGADGSEDDAGKGSKVDGKGKRPAGKSKPDKPAKNPKVDVVFKSDLEEDQFPEVQLFGPVLDDVVESLAKTHGQDFVGLQTGSLPTLDEWTLGLRGLILLGGETGVGKTSLGIQFGLDVVRQSAKTCFAMLSLDLNGSQVHRRLLSAESTLPWRTLILGADQEEQATSHDGLRWTEGQLERFQEGIDSLAAMGDRIAVIDATTTQNAVSIEWLGAAIEAVKESAEAKIAYVLIDNLAALTQIGTGIEASRNQSEVMGQLLAVQRATGDVIMVIDHEHTDVKSMSSRMLSAPDCLMFLNRDRKYGEVNDEQLVHLEIKGRDGIENGELALRYYPNCGYFVEDEEEENDDPAVSEKPQT
jgi:hypothetical protein